MIKSFCKYTFEISWQNTGMQISQKNKDDIYYPCVFIGLVKRNNFKESPILICLWRLKILIAKVK